MGGILAQDVVKVACHTLAQRYQSFLKQFLNQKRAKINIAENLKLGGLLY